jgi:UDPglucose--hexose-1-phosphate uridylyltransferase
MPELRRDPLLDRWVIIAAERGSRPAAFDVEPLSETAIPLDQDPFAEGNEEFTPGEVFAIRPDGSSANGPGWTVRVVPNMYPALRIEGALDPRGYGVYDRMNGVGAHEVVIDCPRCDQQLADLPLSHMTDVFYAYRQRVEDLSRDKRFAYVLVFKNHGRPAGATQAHSHSQIVATPIVPRRVTDQLRQLNRHWKEKRRSLFQDILDQETRQGERVVFENEHMLAFCPFASSFPFEICILPKRICSDFRRASMEELRAAAEALKVCLHKWRGALGNISYNYLIHTEPNDSQASEVKDDFPMLDAFFCWHIEMFPRTSKPAGFEWGTGFYINVVPPEEAAEVLRGIEVDPR